MYAFKDSAAAVESAEAARQSRSEKRPWNSVRRIIGVSVVNVLSLEKRSEDNTPRIRTREADGTEAALQHQRQRPNSSC